jgi:hypothetical protein
MEKIRHFKVNNAILLKLDGIFFFQINKFGKEVKLVGL